MSCANCSLPIESDGHGEYIHCDTWLYACASAKGQPVTVAVPRGRK